jgi:hypothetical protein
VAIDIRGAGWLAALVDEELSASDAAAARLRLPTALLARRGRGLDARARELAAVPPPEPAASGPLDRFLDRFRGDIRLALDVALLAGVEPDGPRSRAGIAALFAALAGEVALACAAAAGDPADPEGPVVRALSSAAPLLAESGWPPDDPPEGLPVSSGALRIERLLVARLAALIFRNRIEEPAVRRRLDQAGRALSLLVEALAGQAAAAGRLDVRLRRIARHQLADLRLPRDLERASREAVRAPRTPEAMAVAVPARLRPFLLEQLFLAEALASGPGEPASYAARFAAAASIGASAIAEARAGGGALAARQSWAGAPGGGMGQTVVTSELWGEAADDLVEKVSDLLRDNLEAIAREVRQTGELGQLIAKAAAGTSLTPVERRKVKTQLLDLAKAVPALAIFAAPGGMLLLPLLAKLLPFSVLPSAWDDPHATLPPKRRG